MPTGGLNYLNVTNVRSVADIGSEDIVKELEVRAASLEDTELRKGPTDVQPDELQRLLPPLTGPGLFSCSWARLTRIW